jgi:hypothetical protein
MAPSGASVQGAPQSLMTDDEYGGQRGGRANAMTDQIAR